MANKFKPQLKVYCFDLSDLVSILGSIAYFKLASDSSNINVEKAMQVFTFCTKNVL